MKRDCRTSGHYLQEVMAVVGYRCRTCKTYIRLESIARCGLGRCPKCDAPGDKLEANFWGSEHVQYKCKNCMYSWRELR